MVKRESMLIVDHMKLAEDIYKMTLKGSLVQHMNQPGQFVHIKVGEGITPLLRRPISIANICKERDEFSIIYRRQGEGTTVLSKKMIGEQVDVLGPLGNGFPLEGMEKGKTALLIGGGVGVPPLYELSKQLKQLGVRVIHILGFQSETSIFYRKEFSELDRTFISTVDGSVGRKGFVTDILDQEQFSFDRIYSCGPIPMLKALEERFADKELYISLEERMGCGIGACFACVRKVKNGEHDYSYKKVCSDGPVFHVGEVEL